MRTLPTEQTLLRSFHPRQIGRAGLFGALVLILALLALAGAPRIAAAASAPYGEVSRFGGFDGSGLVGG
ncbi:MAG TPA: hypothetical protein VGH60_02285, partial [Solirubrobacteraceae bacterium]